MRPIRLLSVSVFMLIIETAKRIRTCNQFSTLMIASEAYEIRRPKVSNQTTQELIQNIQNTQQLFFDESLVFSSHSAGDIYSHKKISLLQSKVQPPYPIEGLPWNSPAYGGVGEYYGWRSKLAGTERHYLCKYSEDGRPCGSNYMEMFPEGLHCPSWLCCSKTHIVEGAPSGGLCSSVSITCGSILISSTYSYGKCKCSTNGGECSENAECFDDEQLEHGGVYCKCKAGFLGNGKECFPILCNEKTCHPGKCKQKKEEYTCECPDNYEVHKDEAGNQSCVEKDSCKVQTNPCGEPERVQSCQHVGINKWMCVCQPGFVVEHSENPKCVPADNRLRCAQTACGTVGLESCIDTEDGVTCTCLPSFTLERDPVGKGFQCVSKDPCEANPCGSSTLVAYCSKTVTGYSCKCNESAKVEERETGPICVALEADSNFKMYVMVAAGGGIIILCFIGGSYFFSRGNRIRNNDHLDEECAYQL